MLHQPRMIASPYEHRRTTGRVKLVLINANTGKVRRCYSHNLITRTGLARDNVRHIAQTSFITQMAVGSSLTAPADTDTAMGTLILKKTLTETPSATGNTGSNPYYTYVCQFNPSEAVGNWTECGLHYDDNSLYNHANFGREAISDADQTDPVLITDADHGLTNGTRIVFTGVGGMTQLNFSVSNFYYAKSISSSTFELYNDEALTDTLDGTGFGAFTSGGVWLRSYSKANDEVGIITIEIEGSN